MISALGRTTVFLQVDAPINGGNSRGPTFDMEGEVVGMNTAIYSPSGGNVGIGFDVPAATVGELEHGGVVQRGHLGVRIQPVGPDMAESLGMQTAAGAIVDETMPGTPAADAGIKAGDVITKLDGEPVTDAGDLIRRIGAMKPGREGSAYRRAGRLGQGLRGDPRAATDGEGSRRRGQRDAVRAGARPAARTGRSGGGGGNRSRCRHCRS